MLTEEQKKSYRSSKWKEVCRQVLERDGYCCVRCGRSRSETTLQVHHMRYEHNKLAHEYPLEYLITLCQGCHAKDHGKIRPTSGWIYEGYEDLGDLCGECEFCHSQLRYSYSIYHPMWGYMEVGTNCCDRLTESDEASKIEKKRKSELDRLARFIKSPQWKFDEYTHSRKYEKFSITITQRSDGLFYLTIGFNLKDFKDKTIDEDIKLTGKGYADLDLAKSQALKVIRDGSLIEYIRNHYS